MIIFATTAAHAYTHAAIAKALRAVRLVSYPSLLSRRTLPHATYIFTDFDRLGFWQLEILAHLHRTLRDAGCRVLNDPATALQRLALLRRLKAQGLNTFQAWPAGEAEAVDAFPVFLRTASAHRGNLTEILADRPALEAALKTALEQGYPLSNLMIVEYRAEPMEGDVFRKLALFRLGAAMAQEPSVHQRHWSAKYGEQGVAGADRYAEDLETVRTMPHADAVMAAFQAGGIEYGRADYGLVNGRPEVYEINTNPMLGAPGWSHPFPDRVEAGRVARACYLDALMALDTPPSSQRVKVPKTGPRAMPPRGRGIAPAYLWLP